MRSTSPLNISLLGFKDLPKTQNRYRRGFMKDNYDEAGNYVSTTFDDFAYNSWGSRVDANTPIYDNIGDFFQNSGAWDTNLSISGGSKNGNFSLSGSFYDQDGIIPTTGYTKTTFRFNGEQKFKMFTFGANVAYSQARTDKTSLLPRFMDQAVLAQCQVFICGRLQRHDAL